MSHRLRSAIAMLAIILGAGSVLATFALTEGMARQEWAILKDVGGVERFSLVNAPVPMEQEDSADTSPGLTVADVKAIRRDCPSVRWVATHHRVNPGPVMEFSGKRMWDARIRGTEPDLVYINRYEVEQGRFLSDLDVTQKRTVCVIGNAVASKLGLLNGRGVGRKVTMNGVEFKVVGILKPAVEFYKNRDVLIPYSTAQAIYEEGRANAAGESAPNRRIAEIKGSAVSAEALQNAIREMQLVLARTHRGIEDFGFNTEQDWADSIKDRVRAVKVSGLLIAGVSLLVGGIGVTNVMLAAIKQRVREIGVRRAIGARRSDVFVQILLETVLLAGLGGVLGIAAGFGLTSLLALASGGGVEPVVLPEAIWTSLAAAGLTGLLAGCYPAWAGARLSPMEALRYE